MAAPTELFQNHLDVHIPQAAGGNIHIPAGTVQHKGGLDPPDGQQLVGRLGRRDPQVSPVLAGSGNGTPFIDLRPGNQLGLLLVGVQRVGKELFHGNRVRAPAPQKRGSFKSAYAGLHHKVVGIQHNARQQRLGVHRVNGRSLDVLGQFRHHFRGGTGIGLMVENQGVFDMGNHHPVMVDHHHTGHPFQQFPALHKIHRMGVHHDQQGAVCSGLQRLQRTDEQGLLRIGFLSHFHQGAGQGLVSVENNVRRLFQALVDSRPHPHRAAHAVQVRIFVPHDEHLVAGLDVVGEGGGYNARPHLIPLFHTFREAAEELIGVALLLDSHLVAAPAQSHVQGLAGPALAFGRVFGPPAHPNGHGGTHIVPGAPDGTDFVQHPEPLLLGLLDVSVIHHKQVAAAV